MAPLYCLLFALSLATAVPHTKFYMVFKSEWVRGYAPQHKISIDGSHPVAFFSETQNKTCRSCSYLPDMHDEYEFLQIQGRYLQTLGDKWRSIVRATIVHTCYFGTELVCDTETVTNRGQLTVRRTENTVQGHGSFLQLIGSVDGPGLQFLREKHDCLKMHWREPLYDMKKKSQPANVGVTLQKDPATNVVSCTARCSSPFPISVSLVGRNGASVSGSETWSFIVVSARATSNDLSFNHCRVESIFGWSIVITNIPEGTQDMRLLEHDVRQEKNEWKEETIVVKPPHRKPVATERPHPTKSKEPLSLWTILYASSVVLVVVITCLVAFIVVCQRYTDGERDARGRRRARDVENGSVDYMRF